MKRIIHSIISVFCVITMNLMPVNANSYELHDFNLVQNRNEVALSFVLEEDQLDMTYMMLEFYSEDSGEFMCFDLYVDDFEVNQTTYQTVLDLSDEVDNKYLNYTYGTYQLMNIMIEDKDRNVHFIDDLNSYKIDLLKEDNVLETLTKEDILVHTRYLNNQVYFRKESGVGSGEVFFNYLDLNGEEKTLYVDEIDVNEIDLTKVSTTFVTIDVPVLRNVEDMSSIEACEMYSFEIDVNVVDVTSKMIETDYMKEVAMTYEDYMDIENTWSVKRKIVIQLDNGEIMIDYVKGFPQEDSFNESNKESIMCYYNPMIEKDDENMNGSFSYSRIVHLIDQDQNLVDFNGNIRIAYEDRKEIDFDSNSQNVHVSSLEGTLPSYTIVNMTKVDENTVDISFVADYEIIQPIGNVKVKMDVSKELEGKEVTIYQLQEDHQFELTQTKVINQQILFEINQGSVYSFEFKDIEDTVIDEETSSDASNTTDVKNDIIQDESVPETPKTGDDSNVLWYIISMIVALCILVMIKKKK